MHRPQHLTAWTLGASIALLVLLWLPGLRYPVISDSAGYALLGESVWTNGTYELLGEPHARHLPVHAIVSYPLTAVFGYSAGMKVSTLLAAAAVIALTFVIGRRSFGAAAAAVAALALATHHGFTLMTQLGSADLLFTALFLFSVWAFQRADDDRRWYLAAGIAAGLSCLTRYNGLALFPLFGLWVLWKRRVDLRSGFFWAGMGAGAALFALWPLRNFLVFGDPLHSEYGEYLDQVQPNYALQFLKNIVFYGNPAQNILPVLLLCALYGLVRHGRRHVFLIAAMLAAWVFTAVWPVQGMRFAMPGYPILLLFAAAGLIDLLRRFPRATAPAIALLLLSHAGALCLYSSGSCNAWADRHIGIVPRDLGIASEGFHAWDQARDFINANAGSGASVYVWDNVLEQVWAHGVFRDDIRVMGERRGCPFFMISEETKAGGRIVFQTSDAPVTYVLEQECV